MEDLRKYTQKSELYKLSVHEQTEKNATGYARGSENKFLYRGF